LDHTISASIDKWRAKAPAGFHDDGDREIDQERSAYETPPN
jgi:hypothetical protein